MKKNSFNKIWKLLNPREKRQALWLLCLIVLSAGTAILMVGSVMPFLLFLSNTDIIEQNEIAKILHTALGRPDTKSTIIILGAATVVVIIFSNLVNALRIYALTKYVHMRAHSLSSRLFSLQVKQPIEYTLTTSQAVFIRRAISDSNDTASNFMMPFGEMLSGIITATGLFIFLYFINPTIMISVSIFFLGAFAFLFALMKGRVHDLGKKRVKAYTKRSHTLQETLRCFKDIKMSGSEEYFIADFNKSSKETHHAISLNQFYGRAPRFLMQTIFFGGIIVASTILAIYLDQSQTTFQELLPTLGAFAFGGQRLIPELQTIYNARSQMAFGKPSIDLLEETFSTLTKDTTSDTQKPIYYQNNISLLDVSYAYPNDESNIIPNINLTIKNGDSIGIVGQSGSGKSTLCNILMGLLSPKAGQMLVDHTHITDETRKRWRQSVSYVPQDVQLFHDTLRKNLTLHNKPKSDGELIFILEQVQLNDWFETLEYGLDTIIHGPTAQLSGGQKQRLGIARALAKDAELYVFDEATSALDTETERHITSIINTTLKNKTTITIAHRTDTLRHCERILEISNGCIIFDGSHDDWQKTQKET